MSSVVVDGSSSALLSSAAEAIEGSDDLVTEILSRLPAKSLIRFKCVSKRWLSFISDPDFCRRHTLRHPTTRASGIFIQINRNIQFASLSGNCHSASLDLDLDPDGNGIKILQSCNGLLLCSSIPSRSRPHKYLAMPTHPRNRNRNCNRKYFIYNPTTKHFKVLPRPPMGNLDDLNLNLAFDPSRSPNYTVVCVPRAFNPSYFYHPSYSYHMLLYSSEAEAERGSGWKRGPPFLAPASMDFGRGVYWNGAVHWIHSITRSGFLSFHLSQECVMYDTLPPVPHSFSRFVAAAACGHLHLVEDCINASNLRVFRLETRDYSRWVLTYNTDLTQVGILRRYYSCYPRTLVQHDHDDDDEEDPSLLFLIPAKIIRLRLKDNTVHQIWDAVPDPSGSELDLSESEWDYMKNCYADAVLDLSVPLSEWYYIKNRIEIFSYNGCLAGV